MQAASKQSALKYVVTFLCAFAVCIFVAISAHTISQTAFGSLHDALADSTPQVATSIERATNTAPVWILPTVVALGTIALGALFGSNVVSSNQAIGKCSKNGTVILEPNYDFAITRYLLSKVIIDLSRTDFSERDAENFPFEDIHRLVEVRLRETTVPDEIAAKLLRCRSLSKIDLSNSELSHGTASALAELKEVQFVVDGVSEAS